MQFQLNTLSRNINSTIFKANFFQKIHQFIFYLLQKNFVDKLTTTNNLFKTTSNKKRLLISAIAL